MTGLSDLAGGDFASNALSVSANGGAIVGSSSSALGTEAVIWKDDGNGNLVIDTLQNVLLAMNVDITQDGWSKLTFATAISPNGKFVVGNGKRNGKNEAFVVTLDIEDVVSVNTPLPFWALMSLLIALSHIGCAGLRKRSVPQKF